MKELHKETTRALSDRIKAAKTSAEFDALERKITRHYNAGTIGGRDLARLDSMIMTRRARGEA